MPELPEVESVRRQLAPEIVGRRVTDVWSDVQRRFRDVELVTGRLIESVERRGKFLICLLDDGNELVLHLGMTGSFHFDRPDAWTRARFTLDDGRTLVFRDPRRFGQIAVVPSGDYRTIPTLSWLGPDALSDDFEPRSFARALAATVSPVKPYLLSQRPVAGVGNIYADEALWRARIHPASRRVATRRAATLHGAIRAVMVAAVEREGTTFRDYRMVNGESGRFAEHLQVYGRGGEPCARCGRLLRRIVLGGRGTVYCATCQRA